MKNLNRFLFRRGPLFLLFGFSIWFCLDIVLLKRVLIHPDIFTYYYPLRNWFTQRLLQGEFTLWNPYWGIGSPVEGWTTVPFDLYTLFEAIWGPQYHVFQLFQLLLLLTVVWQVFVRLGLSSMVAAAGAILFFLSPWVTYFFFYFLLSSSYIGYVLSFYFTYRFFETKADKYLVFLALAHFASMFGTKIEFWFSNVTVNVFLIGLLSILSIKKDGVAIGGRLFVKSLVAMLMGVLTHAWQINFMMQIMASGDRVIPHGFHNLWHSEMYAKLLFSVKKSDYLPVLSLSALAGLIAYAGHRRFSAWRASPLLKVFSLLVLFSPLAVYWLRKGTGELGELSVIRSTPLAFRILLMGLVFIGLSEFSKKKWLRIAYFSVLFLFFMREQGQVLLVYLTGLQWIPTRESYIIDFALALIATSGLSVLEAWLVQWRGLRMTGLVPAFCIFLVVGFYFKDPYQVHSIMAQRPGNYPFYNGHELIRETLHKLERSKTSRIMLINADGSNGATYGWGDVLFEELGSVTQYSSVPPKNYKDWNLYKRFNVAPDSHWGGYTGAYTKKMLSLLPQPNKFGFDDGTVYFYSIRTVPPLQASEMRLLGVDYIVKMFPTFGNERWITNEVIESGIEAMKKSGAIVSQGFENGLEIWKVINPLPRAFLLPGGPSIFSEIENSLDATVAEDGKSVKVGNTDHKVLPAQVETYDPEHVVITTQFNEDGYLVLTDLFHPFWHVKVDGQESPIVPAFSIFRAVALPKGEHRLEFYCKVGRMIGALAISLTSLLLILAFALRSGLRRARPV